MNFTKNISKIYLSVSDVSYIYILNYFYHPAFVQNRYCSKAGCSKADCSKADFQLEHVLVPRLFPYTSVNRTTCFKLLIDYSEQCIVLSSRWTMLCYIHKVLYLEKLSIINKTNTPEASLRLRLQVYKKKKIILIFVCFIIIAYRYGPRLLLPLATTKPAYLCRMIWCC